MTRDEKLLNVLGGKKLTADVAKKLKQYVDGLTASDLSAADNISYSNSVLSLKSGDKVLHSIVIEKAEFVDPDEEEGVGDADLLLTEEDVTYIFENADSYEYEPGEADSDMLVSQNDVDDIFAIGLADG